MKKFFGYLIGLFICFMILAGGFNLPNFKRTKEAHAYTDTYESFETYNISVNKEVSHNGEIKVTITNLNGTVGNDIGIVVVSDHVFLGGKLLQINKFYDEVLVNKPVVVDRVYVNINKSYFYPLTNDTFEPNQSIELGAGCNVHNDTHFNCTIEVFDHNKYIDNWVKKSQKMSNSLVITKEVKEIDNLAEISRKENLKSDVQQKTIEKFAKASGMDWENASYIVGLDFDVDEKKEFVFNFNIPISRTVPFSYSAEYLIVVYDTKTGEILGLLDPWHSVDYPVRQCIGNTTELNITDIWIDDTYNFTGSNFGNSTTVAFKGNDSTLSDNAVTFEQMQCSASNGAGYYWYSNSSSGANPIVVYDDGSSTFVKDWINESAMTGFDSDNKNTSRIYTKIDPNAVGLVGLWYLDEGVDDSCGDGLDICDSSGNGKNLTEIGAFSWENENTTIDNTTYIFDSGYQIRFDGGDDGSRGGSRPTTVLDNWSLSAWINPDELPGTVDTQLAVHIGTSAGGYGFGLGDGGGNVGSKFIGMFGGVAHIDSGFTFPAANVWYHVVMTRRSGITHFYVDGVKTASTTATVPVTVPDRFSIGTGITSGGTDPSRLWDGMVDEVALFEIPLFEDEIASLYERKRFHVQPVQMGLGAEEQGDTDAPTVSFISPTNTTYATSEININVTILDATGVDTAFVEINGVNRTLTNDTGNWNTNASLVDGNYYALIYTNDTLNYWNVTEIVYFTVETFIDCNGCDRILYGNLTYSTVDVYNGGVITVTAYTGADDTGTLYITATEYINISSDSKIVGNSSGFAGGLGGVDSDEATNGEGPGGGINCVATAGGGAGYGGIGGKAGQCTDGAIYGTLDGFLGQKGSGGAGADYQHPLSVNNGTAGGAFIFLSSPIIEIHGNISVNANNALSPLQANNRGAGGGSGGSIVLNGTTINIDNSLLDASGGNGATGSNGRSGGGGGAGGRVKIFALNYYYDSSTIDVSGGSRGIGDNPNGNAVAGSAGTIFYQTYLPVVVIDTLTNTTITDPTPELNTSFTVFGGTPDVMWYSVNGAANSSAQSSPINVSLSALPDGIHYVTVYANDTAGNEGETTVYFTIDTIPLKVTILNPPNSTISNQTVGYNLSVTDFTSNIDTCFYSQDGGANTSLTNSSGNWNAQNTSVSEGTHTVDFFCNDTVGNVNQSESRTFVVDVSVPTITSNTPNLDNSSQFNLNFNNDITCTDNIEVFNCTYNIYNSTNSSIYRKETTSIASTSFSYTDLVDTVALQMRDGFYNMTITAWDAKNRLTDKKAMKLKAYLGTKSCSRKDCNFDKKIGEYNIDRVEFIDDGIDRNITFVVSMNDVKKNSPFILSTSLQDDSRFKTEFEFISDVDSPTIEFIIKSNTKWYMINPLAGHYVSIPYGVNAYEEIDEGGIVSSYLIDDYTISLSIIKPDCKKNELCRIDPATEGLNKKEVDLFFEMFLNISIDVTTNITGSDNSLDYNITVSQELSSANYSLDGGTNYSMNNDSTTNYFNLSDDHATLSDGLHNITFYVEDIYGDVNEITIWFTVDTGFPIITYIDPLNTSFQDTTPDLNVTLSDALNGSVTVWYSINGSTNSTPIGGVTNLTVLSIGPFPDGTHNVTVYANDSANNVNSSTRYFTVDNVVPVLSNIRADAITATSSTLLWDSDESSDSRVDFGTTSGALPNAKIDINNVTSHSIILSSLAADTMYFYKVTSVDIAGNSIQSGELNFTTTVSSGGISGAVVGGGVGAPSVTIVVNVTVKEAFIKFISPDTSQELLTFSDSKKTVLVHIQNIGTASAIGEIFVSGTLSEWVSASVVNLDLSNGGGSEFDIHSNEEKFLKIEIDGKGTIGGGSEGIIELKYAGEKPDTFLITTYKLVLVRPPGYSIYGIFATSASAEKIILPLFVIMILAVLVVLFVFLPK